jgi:hypothetical protein
MTDTNAIDGLLEGAVGEGTLPGVVAVAGDRDGCPTKGRSEDWALTATRPRGWPQ